MMRRVLITLSISLAFSALAFGEEEAGGARTLSGMSILGNEEAPKALVIVPWKASEPGDDVIFSDISDDRVRPIDKEVFTRQLGYYEIRSKERSRR